MSEETADGEGPDGTKHEIPPPTEFFFDVPLYKSYAFDKADHEDRKKVAAIDGFEDTLDCHCPWCEAQATFRGLESGVDLPRIWDAGRDRFFTVTLQCTRNTKHTLHFWFLVFEATIQKVGQFPSLADLQEPGLRKYRRVLDPEKHRELVRGVRLSANGVGIGAFVYLRRVFEHLRDEAHRMARQRPDWDEDTYVSAQGVPAQIRLLKNELPQFLAEHPELYGILSKGIHNLSEEECLQFFPVVRAGIELILEQKLEDKRKKEKEKEASRAIRDAGFQIETPNSED